MYFLRARYMNPGTGRFWTLDKFEGIPYNPSSLHKYLYTGNDPINRIDPTGKFTGVIELGIVVLAVAILATAAVLQTKAQKKSFLRDLGRAIPIPISISSSRDSGYVDLYYERISPIPVTFVFGVVVRCQYKICDNSIGKPCAAPLLIPKVLGNVVDITEKNTFGLECPLGIRRTCDPSQGCTEIGLTEINYFHPCTGQQVVSPAGQPLLGR